MNQGNLDKTLSSKIAKNTGLQFVGKILTTILGILSISIITRYLGQYQFGQYVSVINYLAIFATIADLGVTLVTVQLISQPGANQKKILANLLAFRLVSAVSLIGTGTLIAWFLPYSMSIKIGIIIASVSFVFISLNQVLVGLFQKNLVMGAVVLADIVSKTIMLIGFYLIYIFDYGFLSIMFVMLFSSFFGFLFHLIPAQRITSFSLEFDFSYWKVILKKSWPLAITIFFNVIYLKTDILILSLTHTQSEVGIYGAAYRVIEVLITFPFMFAGIVLPILTMAWAKNSKEKFGKIMQKSFDFVLILSLPMFFGVLFEGKRIMSLLAGSEFVISSKPLVVLMLANIFVYLSCILAHGIIAAGKQQKLIFAYVLTALTTMPLYFYLIPKYSYMGAAWATVYSEAVITVLAAWVLSKELNFLPKLYTSFKTLVAALIMSFGLFYFSRNFYLLFSILSAASIYIVALYFLKVVSLEDLNDFIGFRPKKKNT